MTEDLDIDVQGMEELQLELERLFRQISGPALLRGVRNATLLVQRDAKRNSPVDTGRLRASITPAIRQTPDAVVGVVGTNVSYAPDVEEPGPVRGVGRRPYLRPALEENENHITAIIMQAIGREID